MTVIITDFNYKGTHFESYKCIMPDVENIEDVTDEMVNEYLVNNLDAAVEDE